MIFRGRITESEEPAPITMLDGEVRLWRVTWDPSNMFLHRIFRLSELGAGGFDAGTIFTHIQTGEMRVVSPDGSLRKMNEGKEQVSRGRGKMGFEKSSQVGGTLEFYNRTTDHVHRQAKLKPGDFYVIKSPLIGVQFPDLIDIQAQAYVLIYGQILDARNCEPGFFNVIAYSAMCPNGEEGELCILDITRVINRDEFEMARRECWTI